MLELYTADDGAHDTPVDGSAFELIGRSMAVLLAAQRQARAP